ncbi:MAG: ATP-binding cassette domain-containing protein [Hyphomonas sp.]|uniref:ABC transporter ATP-binding protein n=1 Tax=Hyphomonas sp. TaxID=87 RepID=UPI001853C73F|nr:ATP-binding cassette domain-containing protein [Hyphomonas sp.]MBA3070323.1 ATP-binding cassette domain-containing protein [Hyphomonas sp.]MBU3921191.1 ATP-binding cassette domain-containing protein [Alphaproteobacteria bacterium]MBU4062809.1 ATP-binding cassette domain-containing protein [Alphaproteobacteria bacterium]MBU4163728.1 ATP-binding cassette domain-containing protein [Alphaproteobacteria bacterium]
MGVAPLVMSGATKRFGAFTAVSNLSFDVPAGQIVGFLGPNGAGKSTSLRMALGVMAPDEGEVALFGVKPDIRNLRRVGFLPEERGLYKKMTARDTITYFARLKGMTAADAKARANELLDATGLGKFKATRISKLSKGMAQKVQILSTLAHRPDFLILDEPFSGLDPMNQQTLEDLIRAEHQRGATILFSTHVMEHAERLCDRIVMMARGRKVFDGTLEAAYETLGQGARIAVEHGFDLAGALAPKGFEAHRAADKGPGDSWRVDMPKGRGAQDVLRAALEAGAPILGFQPEEARLRDVFVALVGEAEAAALDVPGAATEAEAA